MKYPKLKNALLCRILTYVVIIGIFTLPIVIIFCIKPIPDLIKAISLIAFMVGLLIYIFKNFASLMAMDMGLACIHCHNTARTQFPLKNSFSAEKTKKKIESFGKAYPPSALSPKPDALQYKFCSPATVYTCGIEKVLLSYDADYLDKSLYNLIFNSASSNSNALKGKKKARFLDSNQKDAPLNRVTIAFIFAHRIDEKLRAELHKTVCKSSGDGMDVSFLTCVIDLENNVCVFNSLRAPYIGFGYPVINRGIRLIKKIVFNGSLPLADNNNLLEPLKDFDTEQSLWDFWQFTTSEMKAEDKKDNKRFMEMNHGEITSEDDCIYVKWEDRGILLLVELDEDTKTVKSEAPEYWYYPKVNPISKATASEIKKIIIGYYSELGYTVNFISFESE